MPPVTGGHASGLFFMDLYIYSDESGTFDAWHNDYFIFGGIICIGDKERQIASRKFAHVEQVLRDNVPKCKNMGELKASKLPKKCKSGVYRSLKSLHRFAVVIHQKRLNKNIFENRKHKQRYLDFAYKMVLKKCLEWMIRSKIIGNNIENIFVYADEHSTCTDAIYELKEALLNEFKNGTFNSNYEIFYQPIFKNLKRVEVRYCDSKKVCLVRASDIIANHFLHRAWEGGGVMQPEANAFIFSMPQYIATL